MSVSSVTAPAPIQAPEASPPKAPDVNSDVDASSPPQLAPLPPGQGTRIDQIA
jgi:hypothetical protein